MTEMMELVDKSMLSRDFAFYLLIYSVVLISDVEQSDSVTQLHNNIELLFSKILATTCCIAYLFVLCFVS